MKNLAEQGREPIHKRRFFWDSNPSHISLQACSIFGGVSRSSLSATTLAALPLAAEQVARLSE